MNVEVPFAREHIGDLRKVLPACRQLLRDATAQAGSAVNYLVVLAFVITPLSVAVFAAAEIYVLPQIVAVMSGMAEPSGQFVFDDGPSALPEVLPKPATREALTAAVRRVLPA